MVENHHDPLQLAFFRPLVKPLTIFKEPRRITWILSPRTTALADTQRLVSFRCSSVLSHKVERENVPPDIKRQESKTRSLHDVRGNPDQMILSQTVVAELLPDPGNRTWLVVLLWYGCALNNKPQGIM